MKNLFILCFALALALTTATLTAFGQNPQPASAGSTASPMPLSEGEIKLLRSDLRSEKKKLIALNVVLSVDEATKFWPVYDQYVGEMTKLHDGFYATVKDYSENNKTWTDAQAAAMLNKWDTFQLEEAKLRQKYIPLVEKVIPASKAALFFQIDRRLYLLLDLQVSTLHPLTTQ